MVARNRPAVPGSDNSSFPISSLTNGAFGPKKDVATERIIWAKIRVIKITVFYPTHPNPFHYLLRTHIIRSCE